MSDRSWLNIGKQIPPYNQKMIKTWLAFPELVVQSRYKYVDEAEHYTQWEVDINPDWTGSGEFRFMPPPVKVGSFYNINVLLYNGKTKLFENVEIRDVDCQTAVINKLDGFPSFSFSAILNVTERVEYGRHLDHV